jgi:hypothetical protein
MNTHVLIFFIEKIDDITEGPVLEPAPHILRDGNIHGIHPSAAEQPARQNAAVSIIRKANIFIEVRIAVYPFLK